MEKKIQSEEKGKVIKRAGRPKGSKTGLPFVTYTDSVRYTKTLYSKYGDNEMTVNDIVTALSMHQQKAIRVVAFLSDYYGVLEKSGGGYWKLTNIGQGVAKDDSASMRESFTKNPIFASLVKEFEGKQVTDSRMVDSIRKKYKGIDAIDVKKRLTEGLALLSKSVPKQESTETLGKDQLIDLIKLKYSLSPPKEAEIDTLVNKVLDILKGSNDDTLITLSKLIERNKNDKHLLSQIFAEVFEKFGLEGHQDKKEGVTDDKG